MDPNERITKTKSSPPAPSHGRRVLITGGAGFLGINTAAHLIQEGWQVTLLDNLSRPGTERNLKWLLTRYPDRTTFVKEDIRNGAALAPCKETQPLDFHSPYGCSKGAADQYVRDYARCFDMNTVVLRQSCIYGSHQYGTEDQGWVAHFVHSILKDRPLTIYGDGTQVRDLLDARDLSALYATVIDKIAITRGEVYNIGGGPSNQRNLLEVIDQIGEITGKRPQFTFAEWREGDQKFYVSDVEKARKELDWEPQVDFDRGLRDLIAWAESVN